MKETVIEKTWNKWIQSVCQRHSNLEFKTCSKMRSHHVTTQVSIKIINMKLSQDIHMIWNTVCDLFEDRPLWANCKATPSMIEQFKIYTKGKTLRKNSIYTIHTQVK